MESVFPVPGMPWLMPLEQMVLFGELKRITKNGLTWVRVAMRQKRFPKTAVPDVYKRQALSRGARHCWFGDSSRDSLKLIKENIAYCRAQDKSTVLAGDFRKTLGRLETRMDVIRCV